MIRRPTVRLGALFWALAFLPVPLGEAFGAYGCPHHGAERLSLAAAHATDGGHHGAAHTGQPAAADDRPPPGAPAPHDQPCTCAGPCDGVGHGPGALPPGPCSAPAAPEHRSPAVSASREFPPRLPPFLLPYPNAPPPAV